jgi:hypothetical protein
MYGELTIYQLKDFTAMGVLTGGKNIGGGFLGAERCIRVFVIRSYQFERVHESSSSSAVQGLRFEGIQASE